MVEEQKRRVISISNRNYKILCELGKTNNTFDQVLDEIMKKAGIVGIGPELEQS
jgi:hypothetical protein